MAARALVFDACHVGFVLRAVLFVEAVVAVAALFDAPDFLAWLRRLSLLTFGALPATLVWLIMACSLRQGLARLSLPKQQAAGIALGALAGLCACAMLWLVGWAPSPHWLAGTLTGALVSAVWVTMLVLRARARSPAAMAARLSELQARIRPHFLFNTLNSAIALVRLQPDLAETLLEDLSDLFRQALKDPDEGVTMADEIALAQRYLSIEKIRFGDRLQVTWALDASVAQTKLPPLLLQPLLENAVIHGVEPSLRGASIHISSHREDSVVVIEVRNSVPSEQSQKGSGLGLANVRDRLNLLHDVQGQFHSGLKNGEFHVRMVLPL